MTSTRQRVRDHWWDKRLRRHQKILIDAIHSNRFVAILGARQRGKTTGIGFAAGDLGQGIEWTTQDGRRVTLPADDVQLGSQTLKHAKDFTKRSGRILSTFNVGLTENTKDANVFDPRLGSTERITMANGRAISAHAGNPETIQGLSGHVFVDEIASNKHDSEEIFQQGVSVASGAPWRKFIMVGNSSYRGDWWWNFWHGTGPIPGDEGITWEQRRAKFTMLKLDIWSEFPDRILPPDLREIQEIMGPAAWHRWYECGFAESNLRAVSDDLIMRTGIGSTMCPGHAPVIISVDPGLTRNPTGIVVARVGSWAIETLVAEQWYGPTSNDEVTAKGWVKTQMDQIDEYVRRYNPDRIVCDYSNFASALADALEDRYGQMVDKTPTGPDKLQKRWGGLLNLLTDGRIYISPGPKMNDLRTDLSRFESDESGSSSRKMFEAGRLVLTETPGEGPNGKHVLHCDIGAALLQCLDYVHVDAG